MNRLIIRNKSGFTILEVLVAIFILAIGLLGVAALQTTAITGNTFSRDRTMGLQLAEEMVDRIRANAGNNPGIYNGLNTAACAGANPVLGDCTQWQARLLGTGLPGVFGNVVVNPNAPTPSTATVIVNVGWTNAPLTTLTTIIETWST